MAAVIDSQNSVDGKAASRFAEWRPDDGRQITGKVTFGESHSQAQGITTGVLQSENKNAGDPAKHGQSPSTQLESNEKKSLGEKLKGFVAHRAGPAHLVGSLAIGVYIYRWQKLTRGQLGDRVPGSWKPERPVMAAAAAGSLLVNTGVLLSSRGAEVPEGKNIWERTKNVLRHPNKHAIQANALGMGMTLIAMSISNLNSGVKGVMGSQPHTLKRTESIAEIVSGLFYLISSPMIGYSLMKIDKEESEKKKQQHAVADGSENALANGMRPVSSIAPLKPAAEQEIPPFSSSKSKVFSLENAKEAFKPYNPKNLKAAFANAWENDKIGLAARSMAVVAEGGFVTAGQVKIMQLRATDDAGQPKYFRETTGEQRENKLKAAEAKRSFGIIGIAVTVLQAFYSYSRLLVDMQSKQEVAGASHAR